MKKQAGFGDIFVHPRFEVLVTEKKKQSIFNHFMYSFFQLEKVCIYIYTHKVQGRKADIFLAMHKASEMHPVNSKFVFQDSRLLLPLLLEYPYVLL